MLVAAAVLAVACGSDPDGAPAASTVTTPSVTTPQVGIGEAPDGPGGGAVAPPGPAPFTDPGAVGGPGVVEPPPPDEPPPPIEPPPRIEPPPPDEPPPVDVPVAGAVGSLAGWYLRPAGPASIVLEVRSQAGAGPRSDGVRRVGQVLRQLTGKDVTLVEGAVSGTARAWRADELRTLADQGDRQAIDRAVLRLLFLHGGFAENEGVVGVAVRGDVVAVFADRVEEAAGMFGDPVAVEDAVAMHEVGHLLGLVDLVLDTGREDPEHPGHSANPGSVMYYAVESTLLGTLLSGGPPREFDAEDLADLRTIRDA